MLTRVFSTIIFLSEMALLTGNYLMKIETKIHFLLLKTINNSITRTY